MCRGRRRSRTRTPLRLNLGLISLRCHKSQNFSNSDYLETPRIANQGGTDCFPGGNAESIPGVSRGLVGTRTDAPQIWSAPAERSGDGALALINTQHWPVEVKAPSP